MPYLITTPWIAGLVRIVSECLDENEYFLEPDWPSLHIFVRDHYAAVRLRLSLDGPSEVQRVGLRSRRMLRAIKVANSPIVRAKGTKITVKWSERLEVTPVVYLPDRSGEKPDVRL